MTFSLFSLTGLLSVALTLVLAFSLHLIGAAIGGKGRRPGADILVGWAAGCVLYFVIGTLTPLSFIAIDAAFACLVLGAVFHIYRHKTELHLRETGCLLLVALPLIIVVCSMQPNMWDEMTHWLPNAHYLIDNQHFPGAPYPHPASGHAGYPYGLPLVIYGIEMLARALGTSIWPSGIAPVFNLLLLIASASMIMSLAGLQATTRINRWLIYALVLLGVTLLCPTFVSHLVLSAYSDNATAVDFLAIGIWLATDAERPGIRHNVQLALLLVLAVCLKEDNALPALLLVAGAGLWQWRAGIKFLPIVQHSILLCLPMVGIALLWHSYANAHIPQGEMAVRALAEWHPDLAYAIAKGFVVTALHKSGYFFSALVIMVFAIHRWLHKPEIADRLGTLAFATTCTFLGYNMFLAFAYISIFNVQEAERVASLWRYNTHFGLLQTAIMVMAIARCKKMPHLPTALSAIIIAAVVIAPVPLASMLRGDQTSFMANSRAIGRDIAAQIPSPGRVLLIDTARNGLDCVMIRFQLEEAVPTEEAGRVTDCISVLNMNNSFAEPLARSGYIWTDGWPAIAANATGLALSDSEAHLLRRSTSGNWEVIRSWPKLPEGK